MAHTYREKPYQYYKHERGPYRKMTRQKQRAKREQELREAIAHNIDWDEVALYEEEHTEGWESW